MAYGDQVRSIEQTDIEHADQPHIEPAKYTGLASFFVPFVLMLALLFGCVWVVTTMRNVTTPEAITDSGTSAQTTSTKPAPLPTPSTQSK